MGALVAGATMRREFEERLKTVIDEVQKSNGEIVLFIDEVSLPNFLRRAVQKKRQGRLGGGRMYCRLIAEHSVP